MKNLEVLRRVARSSVLFVVRLTLQLLRDPGKVSRYWGELRAFKAQGGQVSKTHMLLSDYEDLAGVVNGHYFHQDLLVASFISQRKPVRHIDVGSRIDGFVAHVASFRDIEVIDVRDIRDFRHSQISFLRHDLMVRAKGFDEITDSLSCLHTIEHFGLGRYGDSIDPEGHLKGLQNLVDMLKPKGILYLSFPIGKDNEVHFNAHRVFKPMDVLSWPLEGSQLTLERFDYVDDEGDLHCNVALDSSVPEMSYGCGIYTFIKS